MNRSDRLADEDRAQGAIDVINGLWPPDSEYSDTAKVGKLDLLLAIAAEWRQLPTAVLEHMANVQRTRDKTASQLPHARSFPE